MRVVIMAGGKGTRIASVKSDVPKPMIPIAVGARCQVSDIDFES